MIQTKTNRSLRASAPNDRNLELLTAFRANADYFDRLTKLAVRKKKKETWYSKKRRP